MELQGTNKTLADSIVAGLPVPPEKPRWEPLIMSWPQVHGRNSARFNRVMSKLFQTLFAGKTSGELKHQEIFKLGKKLARRRSMALGRRISLSRSYRDQKSRGSHLDRCDGCLTTFLVRKDRAYSRLTHGLGFVQSHSFSQRICAQSLGFFPTLSWHFGMYGPISALTHDACRYRICTYAILAMPRMPAS